MHKYIERYYTSIVILFISSIFLLLQSHLGRSVLSIYSHYEQQQDGFVFSSTFTWSCLGLETDLDFRLDLSGLEYSPAACWHIFGEQKTKDGTQTQMKRQQDEFRIFNKQRLTGKSSRNAGRNSTQDYG